MAKLSTADCKRFLSGYSSPFTDKISQLTSLNLSKDWIRIRKYKNSNGVVCRDFANTIVPVVLVLIEDGDSLKIRRERGLCPWENPYSKIEDSDVDLNTYEEFFWQSLTSADYSFGVGTDGLVTDEDEGETHYYYFQPNSAGDWEEHIDIDHLLPSHMKNCQVCESTYVFPNGNVTSQLLALGFTHDKKLDNMSGS